jgi:hypothetical protein
MPFPAQIPRAYTKANVETLKENQIGVYGLFKKGFWVYVGKGDIRRRLFAHLTGDNSCITIQVPTHWVDEVTIGDPSEREKRLIAELNPTCNKQMG